jgi:hypothetical protein
MTSPSATQHRYPNQNEPIWSRSEKTIARKAFDAALGRELHEVIQEAKKMASQIQKASDLWDLEHYLTECRKEIDRKYDSRGSRLKDVLCLGGGSHESRDRATRGTRGRTIQRYQPQRSRGRGAGIGSLAWKRTGNGTAGERGPRRPRGKVPEALRRNPAGQSGHAGHLQEGGIQVERNGRSFVRFGATATLRRKSPP